MSAIEIMCKRYPDIGVRVEDSLELNSETLNQIRFWAQEAYYDCGKRDESKMCPADCPLARVGQGDMGQLKRIIEGLRNRNNLPTRNQQQLESGE